MPRCGSCRGGGDPAPPCWATFREEWSPCEDFYYVRDPVTDRILDIPETFAPLGLLAIVGKLVTALATMGTLAYAIYKQDDNEDRAFMFAYLTFWVLPLQCLYHIMSLSNSLLPSSIWILAAIDQPEDYVEGRCRRTWYLFNLSLAASIIVAGLWWGTVFDPDEHFFKYESIGPHSVPLLMQLLDGFLINRIPIRFNHWWIGLLPFSFAYALWTFLHGIVFDDIGNPTVSDNDLSTNDDVLYDDIDWDNNFTETLIFCIILVFAVGPAVQILLVLVSLYHIPCICMKDRRRYLDSDKEDDRRSRSRSPQSHDNDSIGQTSWW